MISNALKGVFNLSPTRGNVLQRVRDGVQIHSLQPSMGGGTYERTWSSTEGQVDANSFLKQFWLKSYGCSKNELTWKAITALHVFGQHDPSPQGCRPPSVKERPVAVVAVPP